MSEKGKPDAYYETLASNMTFGQKKDMLKNERAVEAAGGESVTDYASDDDEAVRAQKPAVAGTLEGEEAIPVQERPKVPTNIIKGLYEDRKTRRKGTRFDHIKKSHRSKMPTR